MFGGPAVVAVARVRAAEADAAQLPAAAARDATRAAATGVRAAAGRADPAARRRRWRRRRRGAWGAVGDGAALGRIRESARTARRLLQGREARRGRSDRWAPDAALSHHVGLSRRVGRSGFPAHAVTESVDRAATDGDSESLRAAHRRRSVDRRPAHRVRAQASRRRARSSRVRPSRS